MERTGNEIESRRPTVVLQRVWWLLLGVEWSGSVAGVSGVQWCGVQDPSHVPGLGTCWAVDALTRRGGNGLGAGSGRGWGV